MLRTIEGIYEDGQVILTEIPPLRKKTKVLVTFMEETDSSATYKSRQLGTMRGTITMAADFNDPLDDLKDYM